MLKFNMESVYKKYNLVAAIIMKYPNDHWDLYRLSSSISTDDINLLIEAQYDWIKISKRVPWDFILKLVDKPDLWNGLLKTCWDSFSSNTFTTWDFVKINLDKPWSWYWLSANPSISIDIIENNPGETSWNEYTFSNEAKEPPFWDWRGMSINPTLTWNYVERNLLNQTRIPCSHWDERELSRIIPPDYAVNYIPEFAPQFAMSSLNWYVISKNPLVTWDFVKAHPDAKWDWEALSANPSITWNIVRKSPGKFRVEHLWKWDHFSHNPSITWDDVVRNPDKYPLNGERTKCSSDKLRVSFLDWSALSFNDSITWDNVVKSIVTPVAFYQWNWVGVFKTKVKNLDKAVKTLKKLGLRGKKLQDAWHGISANFHMTTKFISKHYENIDFEHIYCQSD